MPGEPNEPGPGSWPVASQSSAINGGVPDSGDSNVVGIVRLNNFGLGICSGSLISPNVVLTARHCVSTPDSEAIVCTDITDPSTGMMYRRTRFINDAPANEMYVTNDQQMTDDASRYRMGKRIVLLPTDTPDRDYTCGHDIALIVLDGTIDGVTPLVPRIDSALSNQEGYNAIGYGNTSDNGNDAGLRRRRNGLVVQHVGELRMFNVTLQAAAEWQGNAGVCNGDSGGPAVDSQGRVVGALSRGAQNCADPVYTRTDFYGDWIKQTVIDAATEAGITAPEWAVPPPPPTKVIGDDCTDGKECISGTCLNDSGRQYCSDPCDTDDNCAVGYNCDTSIGFCIAAEAPPPPGPNPDGKENGMPCSLDGECASGHCDEAAHLCADPGTGGNGNNDGQGGGAGNMGGEGQKSGCQTVVGRPLGGASASGLVLIALLALAGLALRRRAAPVR